jgi:hypothetical protein
VEKVLLDQVCDVYGFHPSMSAIKNVSIQTCATAFDHEDGETIKHFGLEMNWKIL